MLLIAACSEQFLRGLAPPFHRLDAGMALGAEAPAVALIKG